MISAQGACPGLVTRCTVFWRVANLVTARPRGPQVVEVTLIVQAGVTRDLSAQALESGADGFEGSFGDGEGKCRLT